LEDLSASFSGKLKGGGAKDPVNDRMKSADAFGLPLNGEAETS